MERVTILIKTSKEDKANPSLLLIMEKLTKVNGKETNQMGLEYLLYKMVTDMKAHSETD